MDPVSALSVAAAAAQFAEQVLIISERLYQFFKTVKNAPKLSRELRQEALLLSDTLENLRSVFTAPDASKALRKASPSADLLQGFEETIKQIAARVEIKEGEASWKRLVWPFTQKENEDYLAKLERFKSSFQLALQVLQSYFLPTSFADLPARSWTISSLLPVGSITLYNIHISSILVYIFPLPLTMDRYFAAASTGYTRSMVMSHVL